MKRTDIINNLIKNYKFTSYLEIGVRGKENFNQIKCNKKICVDPFYPSDFKMKSSKFFTKNKDKFDIIFIDGSHLEKDVDVDITESLKILNKDGLIVMHDCNPPTEQHQLESPVLGQWNGTVWKSFVKLRFLNENLKMYTIDTDWGCGVIMKGKQSKLDKNEYKDYLKYKIFNQNRKIFLNLISTEEFLKKIK